MGYQASTMLTMLLNELLHSRRTPPSRVLRTVVSGPRYAWFGADGTGDGMCLGLLTATAGS